VSETKPPVSVVAFERQLQAESISKSIAGFYATNLRIDMKNFKRAEKLFTALRSSITDEESLKLHLALIAKHLKQLTKNQVSLVYKSGRISFNRGEVTQSLVFAEQGLEIYTRLGKQVELLRATRYAIDNSMISMTDDCGIWNTYLRDGFKLSELNKALDVAERQRLKFKDLIAKINHKTIATMLSPNAINKAKIKTDKKLAAFVDLVNDRGQRLSLKVTRLVSAALLG